MGPVILIHLHLESSVFTGRMSFTSPTMEISSVVRVMDKNLPESELSASIKETGIAAFG
jgi:hypothetical protein